MLFSKVIVGVGDAETGRDAITLAKALVTGGGAVVLAHVNVLHPVYAKGFVGEISFDGREAGHRLLDELSQASGISSTALVDAHAVDQGLHEFAESQDADLLVLGSSRRGLIGRVLLGDDTRDSLSGTPCAVAIAPAGFARSDKAIHEIGVAFNASDEARHALECSREIAADLHAELSARQAVSLPAIVAAQTVISYSQLVAETTAAAQDELDQLDGVNAHAIFGDPLDVMTSYSASVDLLVIGSRSLGPVGRISHSSMSRRLSRSAQCPLLVIPRGARPRQKRDEQGISAHGIPRANAGFFDFQPEAVER